MFATVLTIWQTNVIPERKRGKEETRILKRGNLLPARRKEMWATAKESEGVPAQNVIRLVVFI